MRSKQFCKIERGATYVYTCIYMLTCRFGMLRVCVAVCVLLAGQAIGHTYFSPLDFLRHDKASVKWGKRVVLRIRILASVLCHSLCFVWYIVACTWSFELIVDRDVGPLSLRNDWEVNI